MSSIQNHMQNARLISGLTATPARILPENTAKKQKRSSLPKTIPGLRPDEPPTTMTFTSRQSAALTITGVYPTDPIHPQRNNVCRRSTRESSEHTSIFVINDDADQRPSIEPQQLSPGLLLLGCIYSMGNIRKSYCKWRKKNSRKLKNKFAPGVADTTGTLGSLVTDTDTNTGMDIAGDVDIEKGMYVDMETDMDMEIGVDVDVETKTNMKNDKDMETGSTLYIDINTNIETGTKMFMEMTEVNIANC